MDLRTVPDLTAEYLRKIHSYAGTSTQAQKELCDPDINPHAAAYFITYFCKTQDEERAGMEDLIPPKPHILKMISFVDQARLAPINRHVRKSRRVMMTWVGCAYYLWRGSHVDGFTCLFLNKTEDHIDDGGNSSTTDSMFGKVRHLWERLPDHVSTQMNIAYMRITFPERNSFILGTAPTARAGMGGGYVEVWGDEWAHLELAEQIHETIDPACKFGKLYTSTVNGPRNCFARIDKEQPDGWVYLDVGWEQDEDKAAGLRATETEEERERFGDLWSPWLDKVTSSLSNETIHQEYGRKYEKSTKGTIYWEFSKKKHVPSFAIRYDRRLPVIVGLDFGHARKTAGTISQPLEDRELRVIGSFAGVSRSAEDNAKALAKRIRELGIDDDLDDVLVVIDPSADTEEIGSGKSIFSWYRKVGFTHWTIPPITGPDSVNTGIQLVKVILTHGLVQFDAVEAADLIDSFPEYKYPIDRVTGEQKSNKPVHNMASHPQDSFRYLVTYVFRMQDSWPVHQIEQMEKQKTLRGEPTLLRRGGVTNSKEHDPDDESEIDDDGIGHRSVTSSLSGMRF